MSTDTTNYDTYGYLVRLGRLPDGIHNLQADAGIREDTNTAHLAFKWKAETPEANVEMSKLFFDALSQAGRESNDL